MQPAPIQIAIFIEETDIAESMHDDLDRAYENLLQGSYNHLQAFIAQPSWKSLGYF